MGLDINVIGLAFCLAWVVKAALRLNSQAIACFLPSNDAYSNSLMLYG
jgi:hypothetical protein